MIIDLQQIVNSVQEKWESSLEDNHQSLKVQTRSTLLINRNQLGEYFKAHEVTRNQMVEAKFPNIKDEHTTVKFNLRSIHSHLDFGSVMLYQTSQPYSTIKKLLSMAFAVQSLISQLAVYDFLHGPCLISIQRLAIRINFKATAIPPGTK